MEKIRNATTEARRRRLLHTFGLGEAKQLSDDHLKFIADTLELRVFDLIDDDSTDDLDTAAGEAFEVARVLPRSERPIEAAEALVRMGCLGILGEGAPMSSGFFQKKNFRRCQ